jgi:hypothetical protein
MSTALCKREYEDKNNLNWFEQNVCINRQNVYATFGLLFLFVILGTMVKRRLDKNKPAAKIDLKKKTN